MMKAKDRMAIDLMQYKIEKQESRKAKQFFYEVLLELDKYVCREIGNKIIELHLMGYTHKEISAKVKQSVHHVRKEIDCFIEKTKQLLNEV